jgi:hypothetical protein
MNEKYKQILVRLAKDTNWAVRATVAENTDPPGETLLVLSRDSDNRVRRYVALNSSTPTDILSSMVNDNDEEVRIAISKNINTATDSLATLALDKSLEIREWVASNLNTSAETLTTLSRAKRPEVAMPIITNPKTPKDVRVKLLIKLSSDKDEYVRDFVAKNPETPDNILQILGSSKIPSRLAILENPNASAELQLSLINHETKPCIDRIIQNNNTAKYSNQLLKKLAAEKSAAIRGNIGIFPLTSVELLTKLSKDKEDTVRNKVAGNTSAPEKILLKLAKDKSMFVRLNVALNSSATENVLDLLSTDDDSTVRSSVASHKRTSARIIETLSSDDVSSIRSAVAKHPNTSKESLNFLSQDEQGTVRNSVALNPNLCNHIRAKILHSLETEQCLKICETIRQNQDTYPAGSLEAFLTLDEISIHEELTRSNPYVPLLDESVASSQLLNKLSNSEQASVRGNIAQNPNVSKETSIGLAQDKDLEVRCKLGANTKVPPEVLAILANDNEPQVRINLASNEGTSLTALRILTEDKEDAVLENLAKNPCVPSEILEKIVSIASQINDDTSQSYEKRRTASYLLHVVARHLNVTPTLIEHLLSYEECKQGLSENSTISVEIMEILIKDENPLVRRGLALNLKLNSKRFDWKR